MGWGAAEYPFMEENFAARAAVLFRLQKVANVTIKLAPLARTIDVFPLAGSEGLIGEDRMDPCQVRCC
jgi:hypothetical protein